MDMNTAALKELQLREDQSERDHKTFGKQVVEDMVDDLMSNRALTTIRGKKVDLVFILDGEGFISDAEAAELIGAGWDGDRRRYDILEELEKRARKMVEKWITDDPLAAEIIAERVRDLVMEQS